MPRPRIETELSCLLRSGPQPRRDVTMTALLLTATPFRLSSSLGRTSSSLVLVPRTVFLTRPSPHTKPFSVCPSATRCDARGSTFASCFRCSRRGHKWPGETLSTLPSHSSCQPHRDDEPWAAGPGKGEQRRSEGSNSPPPLANSRRRIRCPDERECGWPSTILVIA